MDPEWSRGRCFIHGHAEPSITGSCHPARHRLHHPAILGYFGLGLGLDSLSCRSLSLPGVEGACPGLECQARSHRSILTEHVGKLRLREVPSSTEAAQGFHPPTQPLSQVGGCHFHGGPRVPGDGADHTASQDQAKGSWFHPSLLFSGSLRSPSCLWEMGIWTPPSVLLPHSLHRHPERRGKQPPNPKTSGVLAELRQRTN